MIVYLKKYSKQYIFIVNTLIVLFSFFVLYEEYEYYGDFQWVRQDRIEDGEEWYGNIIAFILIIFGIITIIQFVFKKEKMNPFFFLSNIFYGTINLIFGFIFSLFTIRSITEGIYHLTSSNYPNSFKNTLIGIIVFILSALLSFSLLIFGIKLIFKCDKLKRKLT